MAFSSGFSSIFTLQGQKERFSNVLSTYKEVGKSIVNTLTLGATKNVVGQAQRIQANPTLNPTLRATSEFVANKPLTTALIAAVPASSSGRSFVTSSVSKLSTTKKVIGGGAVLFGGSALVGSERGRVATIKTTESFTPESLVRAGGQAGKVIDAPSLASAGEFIRENPVLTAAAVGGAALAAGGAVSAVNTALNTQAVRENTKVATSGMPLNADQAVNQLSRAEVKLKERELDLQESAQKAQLKLLEQQQESTLKLAKERQEADIALAKQQLKTAGAASPPPTPSAAPAPTPKKRKKKKKAAKKKPKKKAKKRKPAKRTKQSKRKTYKRKKR